MRQRYRVKVSRFSSLIFVSFEFLDNRCTSFNLSDLECFIVRLLIYSSNTIKRYSMKWFRALKLDRKQLITTDKIDNFIKDFN